MTWVGCALGLAGVALQLWLIWKWSGNVAQCEVKPWAYVSAMLRYSVPLVVGLTGALVLMLAGSGDILHLGETFVVGLVMLAVAISGSGLYIVFFRWVRQRVESTNRAP